MGVPLTLQAAKAGPRKVLVTGLSVPIFRVGLLVLLLVGNAYADDVQWEDLQLGLCRTLVQNSEGLTLGNALVTFSNRDVQSPFAKDSEPAVGKAIVSLDGEPVADAETLLKQIKVGYAFMNDQGFVTLGLADGSRIRLRACLEGFQKGSWYAVDKLTQSSSRFILWLLGYAANTNRAELKRTSIGFDVYFDIDPADKFLPRKIESLAINNQLNPVHILYHIEPDHQAQVSKLIAGLGREHKFVADERGGMELIVFHTWGTGSTGQKMSEFLKQAKQETKAVLELKSHLLSEDLQERKEKLCAKPFPRDDSTAAMARFVICGN